MKHIKNFWSILFVASVVTTSVAFTACVDEKEMDFDKLSKSNKYEAKWALPAINSRYTMQSIAEKLGDVLEFNGDTCVLVYQVEETTYDFEDFADELSFEKDENVTMAGVPTGEQHLDDVPLDIPEIDLTASIANVHIETMSFSSGTVTVSTQMQNAVSGTIEIVFPNMKNASGESFKLSKNFSRGENVVMKGNLAGYTQTGNMTVNGTMVLDVDGNVTSNILPLHVTVDNLGISNFEGFIGTNTIPVKESIDMKTFARNYQNLDMALDKITADVSITNKFGLPIRFNINKFQAENGATTKTVIAPKAIDIASATKNGSIIVPQTSTDHINVNGDMLTIAPKKLVFEGLATINYGVNPATTPNFFTDMSGLRVNAVVHVPLVGYVDGFKYQDTLEYKFSDNFSEDFSEEDLGTLTLEVYVENGFPLQAAVQLVFCDANYNPIDRLFDETDLLVLDKKAGETVPTQTKTIKLDAARMKKLRNASYVIVDGLMSTDKASTHQSVTIKKSDYIVVRMAAKADISLTF